MARLQSNWIFVFLGSLGVFVAATGLLKGMIQQRLRYRSRTLTGRAAPIVGLYMVVGGVIETLLAAFMYLTITPR